MKTLLSFFLLVSCLTLSAQKSDEEAVRNTVIGLFDQLSDRNTEKLKLYCTDDIQILEDGEIWNLDTVVKKIKQNKSLDFKRINTIDFLNVTIENNTAWTTYNNKAEVLKNGERFRIHWLETAILKKQRKTWKIKVLHSTCLKREKV